MFSSVSAECAVICITYFKVVSYNPFFTGLSGRKGLIIGKKLVYHLCGGIIFVYRWLGYFHFGEVQKKKC